MSWSDAELPEVAHILRALINAPSPNPPGNCDEVASVCQRFLEGTIPSVEVVRSDDGTPSVLVTLGSGDRTLLIHSHYDTQPVSDKDLWLSDPYQADLRQGIIYGRGAGDDKASVAVQMATALTLAREGFHPNYTLRFAFVADEESGGQRGTEFLKNSGHLRADAVLIGEQTDNRVAVGERGIVWIRVTFRGKPAHGAIPAAGVSALAPAAQFVDVLRRQLVPKLNQRHPTDILPASSLNVGKLHAGNDVSTVPDVAVVELDRRIVPDEAPQECVSEVQAILDEVLIDYEGVSAECTQLLASPAFLTAPDHPFVGLMKSSGEKYAAGKLVGYQQASDARFFANDDIPIVIFGPSDPEVGHAANECVSIDQLMTAEQMLIDFCRSFDSHMN